MSEQGDGRSNVSWWVGGAAVLILGAAMLSVLRVAPFFSRSGHHHHYQVARCANNLKQIGLACVMYADDNAGRYPPDLLTLLKTPYLTEPSVFVCPASTREPVETIYDERDFVTDYTYLAGVAMDGPNPAKRPIAYEAGNQHRSGVHNVLFADGHVASYSGPTWRRDAGIEAVIEAAAKADESP